LGGALEDGSPAGSRGRAQVGVWGLRPQNLNCYVMRLKHREKNKSIHIIIIIISFTHRFMFPAIFVLKYKTQSAGSRVSEMVHNSSRA